MISLSILVINNMSLLEKLYSIFAVLFAVVFMVALIAKPELRQLRILLPAGLIAVAVNIGLMFCVLRDVLDRSFKRPAAKYLWLAVILIFWPAVLYYLPKHGFKKR